MLLQPGVGPSGPGVGPERVAEAELIGLPHRPGLAHVHVDGARLTRGRPEEPVTRLARPQDEPQRLQGRPVGRLVVEPGAGDDASYRPALESMALVLRARSPSTQEHTTELRAPAQLVLR